MEKWTRNVRFHHKFFLNFVFAEPIRLAAAKHAEFLRARGRHYSNEAEAMKVSIAADINQGFTCCLCSFILACFSNG